MLFWISRSNSFSSIFLSHEYWKCRHRTLQGADKTKSLDIALVELLAFAADKAQSLNPDLLSAHESLLYARPRLDITELT